MDVKKGRLEKTVICDRNLSNKDGWEDSESKQEAEESGEAR
jgi:hypothetical protein